MPDLVADEPLRHELKHGEHQRIHHQRRAESDAALNCQGLIDFVVRHDNGSRLLIVNTVQTAAVVAQTMRELGHDVLHLSTALAPAHRDLIVERVTPCKLAKWCREWKS